MRKFIINVNGNSYEVEVEEVGTASAAPAVATAPVATVSAPKKAAPKAVAGNGTPVNAPMPGTVLDVKVANGAKVKAGDVVVILEAMKMENEIAAPVDGTVTVVATKGSSVNTGDVLVTIA